jgi:DNA-binding response OmpR family regulator
MRILVADQNALLLAAITATFGPHCDLFTATRRDVCIAQVESHKFDVVIACDKLSDYTGLELLSEVGEISPDTLLIFAANPKRLNQLANRLDVFGLFDVLSHPITPRKLLDVLKRARQSISTPSKPKIKHVVLESEWDTGVRLGLLEEDLEAQAEAAGQAEYDTTTSADTRVEADDFVFSGPPVVSPEPAAPPPRTENRARTFDATPVGLRVSHGANAQDSDAREVIEYEVKPVVLELPHETGTIACDDEFIFASSGSVPVSVSAGTAELIEVEPAEAPVPQEPEPSIEDFCSNDPLFDVPEPPRWAEDGAANDTAYEPKPAAPTYGKRGASEVSEPARGKHNYESPTSRAYGQHGGGRSTDSGSQASDNTGSLEAKPSEAGKAAGKPTPSRNAFPQRRTRKQSVPTEAQRAAFERALARRNAAAAESTATPASGKADQGVKGGARTEPTIQAGSMESLFAGAAAVVRPSKSLSELARMATRKRPLSVSSPNPNKSGRPTRAVYAVGSGLAAALILGVISFELHRNSGETEHHLAQAQATSTQLFSSRAVMLDNNQGSGVPQFGPRMQQAPTPQNTPPPKMPEPETFDPNVAPEDPPPPPQLEQPGPMEPPSEDVHTGPPLGMIQGDDGAVLPPRE